MSKLSRWDPRKELVDIQTRLASLFPHRAEDGSSLDQGTLLGQADWGPAVDVSEDEQEYLLTADLPDVKKRDVMVTIEDGNLVIRGERHQEKEEKNKKKKYHRVERSYGKYLRSFRLPEEVVSDQIKADFKNGVLKVHLPKCDTKKPEAHQVKIA